jgi:hypothetical protein
VESEEGTSRLGGMLVCDWCSVWIGVNIIDLHFLMF